MPDNSMAPAANRNVLNQRLTEIGTCWPGAQPAMVAEVVQSVLASMRGDLFQDITGQRITKVVAALKAIDAKVNHIISAFEQPGAAPPPPRPTLPDVSLENGPQLPASAMDQSDIDKLMASFD